MARTTKKKELLPTLKWMKLSAVTLTCHEAATTYWKFWQDLSREFSIHDKFDKESLELILTVEPIHVCPRTKDSKHYEFFGGFSSLALAESANLETALFAVYDTRRTNMAHRIAQGSILQCFPHNLHSTDGLASFYEAYKRHLWPSQQNKSTTSVSLLGTQHLTVGSLAKMAGLPEDTLKSQIKAFRNTRSTPTDFLERVLKDAEDEP